MLAAISQSPAVWGLLGALIYALPKLAAGVYSAVERGAPWRMCLFEFVIAVFVGVVAAEAFTPWGLEYLSRMLDRPTRDHDLRGAALLIGIAANPGSGRVVDLVLKRGKGN